MEVIEDGNCFVCGPNNERGLQANFEIDRENRRALCRIAVPAGFQGWRQVVHGGILATLLDEACIYACRATGEHFVTAELNVRYRKPVPVETAMTVSAEVVEQKRRLLTVRARLEIEGELHAEADSRVFALSSAD